MRSQQGEYRAVAFGEVRPGPRADDLLPELDVRVRALGIGQREMHALRRDDQRFFLGLF